MNTTISNTLKQIVIIAAAITVIWLVGWVMNDLPSIEAGSPVSKEAK